MTYSKPKSIQDLASNLNIIEHQERPIVVDDFAKNIINKVFKELALILPAWKYAWKSDNPQNPDEALNAAKQQWTKAFIENNICTLEQIKLGFAKARSYESDFVPSCGKFISWCKPTPEDLGYPSEQEALKKCISYNANKKLNIQSYTNPVIIELAGRVDWWTMTNPKLADKHFKETYMTLISSGWKPPQECESARLEAPNIVKDRMSPQQAEDAKNRHLETIRGIKQKIKMSNKNK
jgi:hypothetical protein